MQMMFLWNVLARQRLALSSASWKMHKLVFRVWRHYKKGLLITADHGCFEVCGAQLYIDCIFRLCMNENWRVFYIFKLTSSVIVEYETTATFDICYAYVIFISFSLVRISWLLHSPSRFLQCHCTYHIYWYIPYILLRHTTVYCGFFCFMRVAV
jgi:hypothetical protein